MDLVTRLLRDTGYVLSGFALSLLAFVVVVTGLSAGAGLVVVWVGLGVLAGTLWLTRVLARAERVRLRVLQHRAAPSAYTEPPAGASPLRRALHGLTDPQSWRDAAWAVAGFVTGTVAFAVVVAWWGAALSGLTYWFWQQWLPEDDGATLAELLGLGDGRTADSLLQLALGLLALATLPWVVRGAAGLHAAVSQALLCRPRALAPQA
jgi:hypothetical protein